MENVTGLKRYTEDMDYTLSTKLKLCYNQFMENEIYIGSVYKHYKGNKYVVVSIAVHTETLEELVVYRAIYGDGGGRGAFLSAVKSNRKVRWSGRK